MGAGRGGGPPTPNSPACLPGMVSFPLGHPPALGMYPVPPPTAMIQKGGGMPQDWAGTEVDDAVPWAGDSAMRMGGGDYPGCCAPDTHE